VFGRGGLYPYTHEHIVHELSQGTDSRVDGCLHSPLPPTTPATVFSAPSSDDSLSEGTLQEGPEGPSDGASDAQLS
jgi:hypothetical protein